MYSTMGSGLGQPYSEIMRMPVRWRRRLYEMLLERLDEEAEEIRRSGEVNS